jgi:hypothetical protein
MINQVSDADLQAALDAATVRTFRVPDVGRVRVEIGDEISRDVVVGRHVHGHSYPAHRVSVDGRVAMEGADWGVPVGKPTDGMDAMLALLFWVGEDGEAEYAEDLALWVITRREVTPRSWAATPRGGSPG